MSDMPIYEFIDEAKSFEGQLNLIAGFLVANHEFAPKVSKNIEFSSA